MKQQETLKPITTQEEAIEFQKQIYNEAVKSKSQAAFGEGILQEIYYKKRIELALKYSNKEAIVLDLGCGDGTIAKAIAENVYRLDAVDASQEAVKLAQKINSADNIFYTCTPMEYFDWRKKYDLVLLYEAIEHIFDPDYILAKINKTLKPAGKVIISTPNKERCDTFIIQLLRFLRRKEYSYQMCEDHIREYSYKELKKISQRNGFRLIKAEGLFLSLKIACKLSNDYNI